MQYRAFPYVFVLGIMLGGTLIASRFSVSQFDPITYVGLRLTIASVCFFMIYGFRIRAHSHLRGHNLWIHGFMLGVFGTAIPMVAMVSALQYQSSGVAALLITVNPALTVVMAHFVLADERLNFKKSAGVLLALSGAMLMVLRGETGLPEIGRANPVGYGLILLALISWSGSTIYTRKYVRDKNSTDIMSVRMFIAAIVVMPISLVLVGLDFSQVNAQGFFALAYAALVGTFLGEWLNLYNIQQFGATTSAMTSYVLPIMASLGGVLLLGETITQGMLMGIILIFVGIYLISYRHTPVIS
ncbi:DMT family transporter [Chloroflexota bacterium]